MLLDSEFCFLYDKILLIDNKYLKLVRVFFLDQKSLASLVTDLAYCLKSLAEVRSYVVCSQDARVADHLGIST